MNTDTYAHFSNAVSYKWRPTETGKPCLQVLDKNDGNAIWLFFDSEAQVEQLMSTLLSAEVKA